MAHNPECDADGKLQLLAMRKHLPDMLKVPPLFDDGNVDEIAGNSAAQTNFATPPINSKRCCMRREELVSQHQQPNCSYAS
jgi:hypothetical protein